MLNCAIARLNRKDLWGTRNKSSLLFFENLLVLDHIQIKKAEKEKNNEGRKMPKMRC